MKEAQKAYLAGAGIVTSLGDRPEVVAASVRAGISAVEEVDFFDNDFNPIRMATVPDELFDSILDETTITTPLTARLYRLLQLSTFALNQLADTLPADINIPVFLAGPEQILPNEPSLSLTFIKDLALQAGINVDLPNSRCVSTGRSGGLEVIDIAFKYFKQSGMPMALVGGIDTFYDKAVLDHYVQQGRLLTPKAVDGFIPGEGAGFLLLVANDTLAKQIEGPKTYILEPGIDFEQGYIGSPNVYRGDGLASAVRKALGNRTLESIKLIMSSMNGEHYFAKELGVSLTRSSAAIDEDYTIKHIVDCCGDLGAAIGPIMLGLLSCHIKTWQLPALVCCSSDKGYRSAAYVNVEV